MLIQYSQLCLYWVQPLRTHLDAEEHQLWLNELICKWQRLLHTKSDGCGWRAIAAYKVWWLWMESHYFSLSSFWPQKRCFSSTAHTYAATCWQTQQSMAIPFQCLLWNQQASSHVCRCSCITARRFLQVRILQ